MAVADSGPVSARVLPMRKGGWGAGVCANAGRVANTAVAAVASIKLRRRDFMVVSPGC